MTDSKKIDQIIITFFSDLLGFEPDLTVDHTDTETTIHLSLEPQHSSLVIGHHGEALSALQLILGLMLKQQSGQWRSVRLDVNDYRQQRQEYLENLARNIAQKVVDQNQPLSINNLNSYERRLVHSTLTDFPGVTTESQGEPPHRLLVIYPSQPQPKLSDSPDEA